MVVVVVVVVVVAFIRIIFVTFPSLYLLLLCEPLKATPPRIHLLPSFKTAPSNDPSAPLPSPAYYLYERQKMELNRVRQTQNVIIFITVLMSTGI